MTAEYLLTIVFLMGVAYFLSVGIYCFIDYIRKGFNFKLGLIWLLGTVCFGVLFRLLVICLR